MSAQRSRAWRRHQRIKHVADRKTRNEMRIKPYKNRKMLDRCRDKLLYSLRNGAQMRMRDWMYYIEGTMR